MDTPTIQPKGFECVACIACAGCLIVPGAISAIAAASGINAFS